MELSDEMDGDAVIDTVIRLLEGERVVISFDDIRSVGAIKKVLQRGRSIVLMYHDDQRDGESYTAELRSAADERSRGENLSSIGAITR